MRVKTILNRKELADRWGIDISTLDTYEKEGFVRRLNLPGAKYSLASIETVENDGIDNLIIAKEREIKKLKQENLTLRNVIEMIKGVISI